MPSPSLAKINAQKRQNKTRFEVAADLQLLGTKYLHFDVLHGEFNRELCQFLDSNRLKKKVLLLAPRFSYKTLSIKARIVQEILNNPDVTIGYIHHTLSKAEQTVDEVSQMFLKNEELRALLPPDRRPPLKGKWAKQGEFLIPGRAQIGNLQPTVKAFSTGMDLTGQHFTLLIGDDLISKKTVEEMGGLTAITRWWTSTAIPVIGTGGRALLIGTRWAYDDLYGDALVSTHWKTMLRGILERDGKPDPLGDPIDLLVLKDPDRVELGSRPLTMEDIVAYQAPPPDGMGSDFAGQMLNLPEPEGGRPWLPSECENYVEPKDWEPWIRQVVLLMDPAPKGFGKFDGKTPDKDAWAIALIGYYESPKDPGIMKRVLIDGAISKDWTLDDGMIRTLGLLRKWDSIGTCIVGIEEGLGHAKNAEFYCTKLREVCRGRHRVNPLPFRSTQRGKKPRMADLVSMASQGTFVICQETCSKEFLKMFLLQARSHPHQPQGHDDAFDAVAYLNDPVLHDHIPKASIPTRRRVNQWDPYSRSQSEDDNSSRSRYFNI